MVTDVTLWRPNLALFQFSFPVFYQASASVDEEMFFLVFM